NAASQEVHLQPSLREGRGWPCWWYVRLDGLRVGEPVSVTLTAQPREFREGRVLAAAWSQPDRAAISTDNRTWTQTPPCRREHGAATYQFNAPAEPIWLAGGPPFLPSHAEEPLERSAATVPNAERFVLATTLQGRPVHGIRLGGEG